jgi:hypothetical protein
MKRFPSAIASLSLTDRHFNHSLRDCRSREPQVPDKTLYSNKAIAILSQLPLDSVNEEFLTRLRNQIDADAYDESIRKLALEDQLLQTRPVSIEDFRRLLSHMNTIKVGLDEATLKRIQNLESMPKTTERPKILPA